MRSAGENPLHEFSPAKKSDCNVPKTDGTRLGSHLWNGHRGWVGRRTFGARRVNCLDHVVVGRPSLDRCVGVRCLNF